MSEPPAPRRGVALIIWVGLALCVFSVAWWLYYYSQYGGASAQFLLKLPCVAVLTGDCADMQKRLAESSVPAYRPVLLWAGLVVLVIGVLQQRSRRI
jgi:hypothetical protein